MAKVKKSDKCVVVTSTNNVLMDGNGNRIVNKAAMVSGKPVLLQFTIRSDKDVKESRNNSYKLLVP